jgi:tetratricopeptide (TPR) repeat protein
MARESRAAKDREMFEEHYREGWTLLKQVMRIGTNPPLADPVGHVGEQAIAHFRRCLALEPRSWACMWGLGKAHQAVGNHSEALKAFVSAAALETQNADIWREAMISACAIGAAKQAVMYATAALSLRENDSGLHANAALAFMLDGEDEQASRLAAQALQLDPDDAANLRTSELVRAVAIGARERPRSL